MKSTPVDLIARARGVDLGHNNENPERNIVLLSNTIVADDREVNLANLIDAASVRNDDPQNESYRAVYKGLARGVIAPQRATDAQRGVQDIYVFAASDGRGDKRDRWRRHVRGKNDAGLLASLAAARTVNNDGDIEHSIFRDYSIVVVAAENYQSYTSATSWTKNSPCGAYVQAFCIAAPGAYKYRGISACMTIGKL